MEQNSIVLLSYSAAHDPVSYFLIVSILSDPLSLKMCANWQALIFKKIVSGGNIGPAAAGPAGPTPTALQENFELLFKNNWKTVSCAYHSLLTLLRA